MNPGRRAVAAALAAPVLSGCANLFRPARAPGSDVWSGRIAVQVATPQPQSFSASFELTGDAGRGELTLYTPVGTIAARLQWQPGRATLFNGSEAPRHFESLDALATVALGTPVPVAALFHWLAGREAPAPGWQADLGQIAAGRITAWRTDPAGPQAQLRLVLDR